MHSNNIDWDQLKFVLSIARTGNLSRTAQVLGVNQTTVGRRLSALETQLGIALFHRSKTTMYPTEQGIVVIAQAEVMESALYTMLEQVGKTQSGLAGQIRIFTQPWILRHLIAPRLSEFSALYPGIQIEAVASVRERTLDQGEVEIALRFELPPRRKVKRHQLCDVPYAVYAPHGVDAKSLSWLGFRAEQQYFAPGRWLSEKIDNTSVSLWANDADILHQSARNGMGKALLPMILAEQDDKLQRISGPDPEIKRQLYIHLLPDIERLKRITVFRDWLAKILNEYFHCAPPKQAQTDNTLQTERDI